MVYKKLKPVPWSIENQTALADAELEYQDVEDNSVFVEFPLVGTKNEFLIVWTTTPWTLPANLAVAVHPEVEYASVRYQRAGQERKGLVAKNLVERVFKDRAGVESFEVAGSVLGRTFSKVGEGILPTSVYRTQRRSCFCRVRDDNRWHGISPYRPRPWRGRLRNRHARRP